jgi:hypothetical protein
VSSVPREPAWEPVGREQLKRDCADALEALTRDQRLDGLAEIADALRALGPEYRFHGELMLGALRTGKRTRSPGT